MALHSQQLFIQIMLVVVRVKILHSIHWHIQGGTRDKTPGSFFTFSYSFWETLAKIIVFLSFYGGYKSFLWAHRYTCFGHLVTSLLSFKTRMDSFTCVHNRFLRFIPGVTPSGVLAVSMAAKPYHPHACIQTLVWLESRIKRTVASQHVTRQTGWSK